MIFITAKFRVKPEHADNWPSITADFTSATRAEPGCLWFDWSRSIDDPNEYVLVEAFADGVKGALVDRDLLRRRREAAQGQRPGRPAAARVALLNGLDDVRRDELAAVRDQRVEACHLERGDL